MAIVLSDVCNGFVEIIPEGDDCDWDIEEYIGNKLGYDMDDLQWIFVDDMRIHIDGEFRDIRISELLDALRLRDKMNPWKDKIREGFAEYDGLYLLAKTESLDISEYGENEFFWWKREAYEDMLEYMKRSGI
jgi:hypothetical protein